MAYRLPALKVDATGVVGTITIGDLADGATETAFIKISPDDEGTDFYVSVASTPNFTGTRPDIVIGLGWNLSSGGGRVDASPLNGAIGFLLEQFYINGSGDKTMEFHQVATPPNDVQTRITSTLIGLESPYSVGHYIYADIVVLGSGHNNSDAPSIQITATATTITSPSGNSGSILIDDTDHQLKLLGNGAYAQIYLGTNGELQLLSGNSHNLTLAYGSSAASVTIGPTGTVLSSNDGTSARIELSDGEGPSISAGGGVVAGFQSSVINFGVRTQIHRGGVNLDPINGLRVYNATGAVLDAQQYSPTFGLTSNGFSTGVGGGTSDELGWFMQSRPVQGSVASVNLVFMKEINEAVADSGIYFSSDGKIHGALTGTLSNSATWTLGTDTNDFFKLDPSNGESAPWYEGVSSNPNVSGTRPDVVMTFGWNQRASGIADVTKGHIGMNFEDYFVNEFGDPQSEFYLAGGPPVSVGAGKRFIAVNVSHTSASLTKLLMHADTINLGAGVGPSAGQVQIDISLGAVEIKGPTNQLDVIVSDESIRFLANSMSGKSVYFFEADQALFPGALMRLDGHIIPANTGYKLGLYNDTLSHRALWECVSGFYGQFIVPGTTTADLVAENYNNVGRMALLYPATEDAYANLYVQSANASGVPRWERVLTDLAMAPVVVTGGSAPTLAGAGVGGTDQPTTAGQNCWIQLKDSTGALVWVPGWK